MVDTSPKSTVLRELRHVRWEHCVAGITGGVLSTLVLHPLDLVKIRFQVDETSKMNNLAAGSDRPHYRGVIHALTTIGKTDGIKGLYRGVTPNVWGAGASWGLYFLFYNSIKQRMLEHKGVKTLEASHHMVAAAEAGVFTLVLTNPIWVAKTRLCLQYDPANAPVDPKNPKMYTGMVDCLTKTYKYEGIRGLYKGFVPGMIGVSHGALQFMAYEELKKVYNGYKKVPLEAKFNSLEYIAIAAISKVFAATATYPYQVVRSRLQDQHRSYNGVVDVAIQTWKLEGMRGFYKGLVPYLVHVTPNICMVFLMYEHLPNYLAMRRELEASRHTADITMSIDPPASDANLSNCEDAHDLLRGVLAMEFDYM